jgi:hypothetical protein
MTDNPEHEHEHRSEADPDEEPEDNGSDAFTHDPDEAAEGHGVEDEPGELPEELPDPEENEES